MRVNLKQRTVRSRQYSWSPDKKKQEHVTLTFSLGKNPSKLTKKIVEAMHLCAPGERCIASISPKTKDALEGRVYYKVDHPMSREYFNEHTPSASLQWNTRPEFIADTLATRRRQMEEEEVKAVATDRLAKQHGLYSYLKKLEQGNKKEKSIRPKFECRCGATFKRKPVYLRHQRICSNLREAEEVMMVASIIKAQLKDAQKKQRSKTKDESKDKGKKKRTAKGKGKQVSSAPVSKKRKGKKAAKTAKRTKSKRH